MKQNLLLILWGNVIIVCQDLIVHLLKKEGGSTNVDYHVNTTVSHRVAT